MFLCHAIHVFNGAPGEIFGVIWNDLRDINMVTRPQKVIGRHPEFREVRIAQPVDLAEVPLVCPVPVMQEASGGAGGTCNLALTRLTLVAYETPEGASGT